MGVDQGFNITFNDCHDSPIPNLLFDKYPDDIADGGTNFPLYSPSLSDASRVATGLTFQVINKSATPNTVILPGASYVGITDATATNGIYNSAKTTLTWPFAIRLIKQTSAVKAGKFSGRAVFTVAYR